MDNKDKINFGKLFMASFSLILFSFCVFVFLKEIRINIWHKNKS